MTPEEFLKEQGIDLNQTALLTIVDGFMRQPDLCALMNKFAEIKVKESQEDYL
jgi:hypothetical protein